MKRIGYLFLIITVFTFNNVFAKSYDISQISQVKEVTQYSGDITVDQMDTVVFGKFPQNEDSGVELSIAKKDPIEWIVLEKNDNKILLLSKNILKVMPFSNVGDNKYRNSDIRKWINNEFINYAFSQDEKSNILVSEVKIHKSNNEVYDVTNDKLFILSAEEMRKYFKTYSKSMLPLPTEYSTGGPENWLRDLGLMDGVQIVHPLIDDSSLEYATYYDTENNKWILGTAGLGLQKKDSLWSSTGVRPAMWISLSSNNSVSSSNNKNGWETNSNGLKFYYINGVKSRGWTTIKADKYYFGGPDDHLVVNSWIGENGRTDDTKQYYVGSDGKMYRGRQTPDGKWVGNDGLVVDTSADLSKSLTIEAAEPDSWYKTQSGLWYYFENDRTTTKKGWFTDSRDNQTYYFDSKTGIMAVGWTTINGSEYYFNELPAEEQNWYETGGGFYESYGKKIKALGSMYKNETTPDGKKVDSNGKLIK